MSLLSDLIDSAVREGSRTADSTLNAIDDAIHQAAVRLLSAALPPVVHSAYAVVKAANGAPIGIASSAVEVALRSADVSTALSGAVAQKVTHGLERLSSDTDYARAVRSIRP